jgi:hypothetical protein
MLTGFVTIVVPIVVCACALWVLWTVRGTVQGLASRLTGLEAQGKAIHILVNSDMTAARQNERDQTQLTIIALKRLMALNVKMKLPITNYDHEAIRLAEERVVELNAILADRGAAQERLTAEQKTKE